MTLNKGLTDLFLEMIKIDATSGKELPMAQYIMDYVKALGFEPYMDGAAERSGGNSGNVTVPINGGGDFLLMAHMDTPSSTKGVVPQLHEDRITSDGTTILGVDDRGGVSSILYALKRAVDEGKKLHPCTLLFTVCEETTLAGSIYYKPAPDIKYGFAFDSHMTPGKFVNETCGAIAFKITVVGKASHAGISPEKGVNAIQIATKAMSTFPFGRIDDKTTASISIINGGTATNVIPDKIVIEGEIRTEQQAQGEEIMGKVIRDFETAAAHYGGKIEYSYIWDFTPYRISSEAVPYIRFKEIGEKLGLQAEGFKSMGGSDANSLNDKGIQTINLGVGAQNPHGTNEFILYKDLQMTCDIAYTLLTD